MNDLDRRIGAVLAKAGDWPEEAAQRLDVRLATELSPPDISRKRETRGMTACVGFALIAGFVTTGVLQLHSPSVQAPRWPAAAMDNLPSVLLFSDRGR